jgi:hypothetical protein
LGEAGHVIKTLKQLNEEDMLRKGGLLPRARGLSHSGDDVITKNTFLLGFLLEMSIASEGK